MRTLIWRPSALDQFDSLIGYIAKRDKAAAERIEELVLHAARMIQIVPEGGRPGRVAGAREWVVHPNFIMVYRLGAKTITILRVLHARQSYPQ